MDLLSSTLDYLYLGGWVMVPLFVCSLLMWTLIGERLFFFQRLTAFCCPQVGCFMFHDFRILSQPDMLALIAEFESNCWNF